MGSRNCIYIIPTVCCVNGPIENPAAMAAGEMPESAVFDGYLPFTHECGCAQIGLNLSPARSIPAGMSKTPDAAGFFCRPGCGINDLASFKPGLGDFDPTRIESIACQDAEDKLEESMRPPGELHAHALPCQRKTDPLSKPIVGGNYEGSDGFLEEKPRGNAAGRSAQPDSEGCQRGSENQHRREQALRHRHLAERDYTSIIVDGFGGFRQQH